MTVVNVVWFKRDLRIQDHAPLLAAISAGSVLPIYIHEPSIITAPDYSRQHQLFISECLSGLQHDLLSINLSLQQFVGEAIDVFKWLNESYGHITVFAHEETFNWISFQRDTSVRNWFKENKITFKEIPQNGVLRGSRAKKTHKEWLTHFKDFSNEAPLPTPSRATMANTLGLTKFNELDIPIAAGVDKPFRLKGGRREAEALLDKFFSKSLLVYSRTMSSPLTAVDNCSRLSPFLAQGVVSMREVINRMTLELDNARGSSNDTGHYSRILDALKFFSERMYWRSSYLQAFESNPSIELNIVDSMMVGLRESQFNENWFEAWKEGLTGYPMVDASMRMLRQHGWINMRMRGMLMSFAANELWLHWDKPALFLASEFLDYEPAIHYAQMQIHSGTLKGEQTLSYNVVKQAQEHDPKGLFVKKWIPSLQQVPLEYIFEPWTMPVSVQQSSKCIIGVDYPRPIINHVGALKTAKEIIEAAKSGEPIPRRVLAAKRDADLFKSKQQLLF